MLQLCADSKLLRLDNALFKKLRFYAPLLDSLDFWGVDPVTYTRAGTTSAAYRGGAKTIAANVPPLEYDGAVPLGLRLHAAATLQFAAQNGLNDASTVIWFEMVKEGDDLDATWHSTPSTANPFDSSGFWTRPHADPESHYLSEIIKANTVLTDAEIFTIQTAVNHLSGVITPPSPPANPAGVFVTETPAGVRNLSNTTFTLSQDPDIASLVIFCFGGGAMERVASAPAEMEYTASGTGNRTITMGLAPDVGYPFLAHYVVA